MAHEIHLGGGVVAFVDDVDLALVRDRPWRAIKAPNTTYVGTGVGPDRVLLHRLILAAPVGVLVDHADGDGLNNRRSNIRLCSHMENMRNRAKRAPATSPFKGVVGTAQRGGWQVEIVAAKTRLRLGVFESEHDAARAYDRAARLMFGRFARTNETLGLFDQHPDRRRPLSGRMSTARAHEAWSRDMAAIGVEPRFASRAH